MTPNDIATALKQQFGDRIKAATLDAIDPFVVVDATDLPAVCRFLRDDPRLRFDLLVNVSGVDVPDSTGNIPLPQSPSTTFLSPNPSKNHHWPKSLIRHRNARKPRVS